METQDYLSFPASTAPTSLSILQLVKMRLALESTVQQDTGLLARANSNDASGSVDGSITGSINWQHHWQHTYQWLDEC